ncbi:MAG TPA: hypothetical protein VMA83_05560 [Solirubrobacteraceae bacterium]|nr:hypothetical protein [Solirubrobacteraceae bacterium]
MAIRSMKGRALAATLVVGACAAAAPAAAGAHHTRLARDVEWVSGYAAPGTPERLDRVGIIKIGSPSAKNVLVMEPGTSAGGAYFIPFAKTVTERDPEWQVWSVERRENLLERQGMLNKFKEGRVSAQQFFHYYLGYLDEPSEEAHFQPVTLVRALHDGAREWGLNTAVQDLHVVVEDAKALGGKVVLGGHSLGGAVVTAYATWDFGGHPGAEGLSGLLFDDGASSPVPISATEAEQGLAKLGVEPWLAFGGIPAPDLGLFSMVGSTLAHEQPTQTSLLSKFSFLPPELKTRNSEGELVTPDNEAGFGYSVNPPTSPESLLAAQAHVGTGIEEGATPSSPWVWNGAGAITPLPRYTEMLSGTGVKGADGSEWYFPARLTLDTGAIANGNNNPAQEVLGEHAIYGHELPKSLHFLAINSELDKHFGGAFTTLNFVEELAAQSEIPPENVTTVNVEDTYAHNDPNGAYPNNELISHLIPFLEAL